MKIVSATEDFDKPHHQLCNVIHAIIEPMISSTSQKVRNSELLLHYSENTIAFQFIRSSQCSSFIMDYYTVYVIHHESVVFACM